MIVEHLQIESVSLREKVLSEREFWFEGICPGFTLVTNKMMLVGTVLSEELWFKLWPGGSQSMFRY